MTVPANAKNPSFVLQKAGVVSFEERPIPEIQDEYSVKIHVKKTGICGSDIHFYCHGNIGDLVVKAPMVLGHESSGVVVEVGNKVTTLKVGDRVAMEPGVPCRRSHAYKSGHYNRDPDIKFAATPPIDGTLCKYYILPEDFCVKLPDHVSLDEGALVEPTAVAVHAVKNSNIKPGSKVVVFGAGPIGLLLSSVAEAWGASTIVTVDLVESRLELSKKMGATHTFVPVKGDSIPETAAKIRALIGATPDVVLEASGAAVPANTGVEVLGFGGTYMQVGMASGAVSIPAPALVFKELKMTGSFRYDYGDYDLAVEFISTGKVNVKPIITHNVNFEDAEEAYKLVRDGKAVKCVINGPE